MAKISEIKSELRQKNATASARLELVPRGEWPDAKRPPIRVWRSRSFLVQEYEDRGFIRISVTDARELKGFTAKGEPKFGNSITWNELQNIKNAIGYWDKCAVEVYPPKHLEVKEYNMRHLWLLDKTPDYCWDKNAK
ncbi:MAG: DUF7694 domain-containing protein [Microcoleus sp.]